MRGRLMKNEQGEKVRDELEVIKNTADYGIDCVDDEEELREILRDIKRAYGTIVHAIKE